MRTLRLILGGPAIALIFFALRLERFALGRRAFMG
jgi:hypothetical protein